MLGLLTAQQPLVSRRPFRAPHHTVSNAGLAGGGSTPKPGEISLAHKGVLFLDEMPEFRKDTLDLMRQPLEDGQVTISRVSGAVTYPAEFMLVCAMNPCKCGWYGDPSGRCRCSEREVESYRSRISGPLEVESYRSRISGPLLDRIDIVVEVPAVHFEDLRARAEAEPSSAVRQRVNQARAIQNQRFGPGGMCNARMGPQQMRQFCDLSEPCAELMKNAFDAMGLTARSYDRILRVARTVADLDGSETIDQFCDLSEPCAELMKNAFDAMGLTARSYDRILRVARTVADLDGSETIEPQHIAEAIQYRAVNLGNR